MKLYKTFLRPEPWELGGNCATESACETRGLKIRKRRCMKGNNGVDGWGGLASCSLTWVIFYLSVWTMKE